MERYSVLRVEFVGTAQATEFCDLVNEYKDRVWKEASEQLVEKQMSDVAAYVVPAKSVFMSYVERLKKLLQNPGVESEDYRLLQNCTVSRMGTEVQLVVEGSGNVERIAEEWVFLLASAGSGVISSVQREAKS